MGKNRLILLILPKENSFVTAMYLFERKRAQFCETARALCLGYYLRPWCIPCGPWCIPRGPIRGPRIQYPPIRGRHIIGRQNSGRNKLLTITKLINNQPIPNMSIPPFSLMLLVYPEDVKNL